jgi:hypothetical protein
MWLGRFGGPLGHNIHIHMPRCRQNKKNDGLRARRGAQMSSDELIFFCSNRPIFSVDIIRTYAPVDAPKRRRREFENKYVQADHAVRADS